MIKSDLIFPKHLQMNLLLKLISLKNRNQATGLARLVNVILAYSFTVDFNLGSIHYLWRGGWGWQIGEGASEVYSPI